MNEILDSGGGGVVAAGIFPSTTVNNSTINNKIGHQLNNTDTYFNLNNSLHEVYVVGKVGHPNTKIVRIVHLGDTHSKHFEFVDNIPMGHILIHSGDFGDYQFKKRFYQETERDRQLHRMNHFFGQLPHPYKIFVPGNEDFTLEGLSPYEIQKKLSNVIYLHDNSCTLFGLKIYGTPWNVMTMNNMAMGFSRRRSFVEKKWNNIPEDVDVLVSHMTPWNHAKLYNNVSKRIRPIMHLFGDDREGPGIIWKDQILFSNGAMYGRHYQSVSSSSHSHSHSNTTTDQRYVNLHSGDSRHPRPIVIDVYVQSDQPGYVDLPIYSPPTMKSSSTPSSSASSTSTSTSTSSSSSSSKSSHHHPQNHSPQQHHHKQQQQNKHHEHEHSHHSQQAEHHGNTSSSQQPSQQNSPSTSLWSRLRHRTHASTSSSVDETTTHLDSLDSSSSRKTETSSSVLHPSSWHPKNFSSSLFNRTRPSMCIMS